MYTVRRGAQPYRHDFEYIDQVEAVLKDHPNVNCLWVSAGVFGRGLWEGFPDVRWPRRGRPNAHAVLAPNIPVPMRRARDRSPRRPPQLHAP
eukprot:6651891-Prymnesium_polylepis.2